MTRLLLRDPIARIVVGLWGLIAAAYVVPGVPPGILERLGDQYSTTPLWPWAVAACLVGLGDVPSGRARRFWGLLALSFGALIVAEIPWAFMRSSDALVWLIATEICFCVYYGGQFAAAASTTRGTLATAASVAVVCVSLTTLAIVHEAAYHDGWASYATYITFDLALGLRYWQCGRTAIPAWRCVYTSLALASALVLVTDVLELLWFLWLLPVESGMVTDLIWTLPPLAFTLVVRAGRLRT